MTIVKWSPFRDLDLVERRMRRMLEDTGFGVPFVPAADVYETKNEFVVELEVPGFAESDLSVDAFDHTVVVKGTRVEKKEEADRRFRLHERLEREFERRFELPAEADTDKLAAIFERGVLELHAPKTPEATPRKIAISKK